MNKLWSGIRNIVPWRKRIEKEVGEKDKRNKRETITWHSRVGERVLWLPFRPRTGRTTNLPRGATNVTSELLIGSKIKFKGNKPIASGGFGQIFQGTHDVHGAVALKRLKVDNPELQNIASLEAEAQIWKNLDHPNILPFLGIFLKDDYLYLVSPWAENGPLPQYLRSNPNVNRPRYILQIADALSYLHGKGHIHGDIKAENVLIASDGRSQLCDFGLSRTVETETISALKGHGSLPWRSPELWKGESKTLKSDVYAFGMVIYEVLSGNIPYHNEKTDAGLVGAILVGDKRPPRDPPIDPQSEHSYAPIWEVAEVCWHKDPAERPWMMDVLYKLHEVLVKG